MTEYVLTPQAGDNVIYGVVDAGTDHEAGMTVLRAVGGDKELADQIFFPEALGAAAGRNTEIKSSGQLLGQGWFNIAPIEPLASQERPGGNFQIGDPLVRRFALKRRDGNWAVVCRYVYLALPLDRPIDSGVTIVEVMNEFLICKDLHDLHGTEFFGYETFTGLPYEPVFENVRRESFLLFASDILWDGQEFRSAENSQLVRP